MKKRKNRMAVMAAVLVLLTAVAAVLLLRVLSLKKSLERQRNAMNGEAAETSAEEELEIYLPDVYYAATGLTMEIYNSQITNQCEFITKYNVLWSCDVGESLERKFSVTATEEMLGEHELKVSIYDNALNLLAEKSCTLKVVEGTLNEGFSLLEIGDELSGNEILCRKLQELAQNRLVFQKSHSTDGFTKEESIASDAVRIFFETNDPETGEANADDIVAMIDAIRADGVMTPIYVVNAVYVQDRTVFELMVSLAERLEEYEAVYLVPAGISTDSAYNYGVSERAAVYCQMADLMFSAFCGMEND